MATHKGIEKLRSEIEKFISCVREDSVKITQFYEIFRKHADEDQTIKNEICESQKYKDFAEGLFILTKIMKRIQEIMKILKNMSHVYVFDFESFSEQLEEIYAIIDSNIETKYQNRDEKQEISNDFCEICFQNISKSELTDYENKACHMGCMNYWQVRIKQTK